MLASKPSIAPSRYGLLQQGSADGNPVRRGDSEYQKPVVVALW